MMNTSYRGDKGQKSILVIGHKILGSVIIRRSGLTALGVGDCYRSW